MHNRKLYKQSEKKNVHSVICLFVNLNYSDQPISVKIGGTVLAALTSPVHSKTWARAETLKASMG